MCHTGQVLHDYHLLTRSPVAVEHALLEENSPYPEVCAAVRNYDEEMPANTIRAWVIGMLLTTIAVSMNMLFSLRNPSISITTYVVQLVAYPLGKGWHKVIKSIMSPELVD